MTFGKMTFSTFVDVEAPTAWGARGTRLADDAFAAFRASLVHPGHFIEKSIEDDFAPLADWPEMAECWTYLRERYSSVCRAGDQE